MLLLSRSITTASLVILLSSCVSNHNLRDGEGTLDGGYQVTKVSDGIYYIYTRTNGGLTENYDAAREMFITQAVKMCGSNNIRITKTNSQLDYSKFSSLMVTELNGYAICTDKGLSEKYIRETIAKYENS